MSRATIAPEYCAIWKQAFSTLFFFMKECFTYFALYGHKQIHRLRTQHLALLESENAVNNIFTFSETQKMKKQVLSSKALT